MRVLVLGGYGLIGGACLAALRARGVEAAGLGRSATAARANPEVPWVLRDISRLDVAGWRQVTDGFDVIVNAAGALQDGSRDDLEAIHRVAVERLVAALDGRPVRLVQISAAGVAADAPTSFLRSKAAGDSAVQSSDLDWVILRPVLVIGPGAYGGTALLRAAAALPLVVPWVLPQARVSTVALDDVAAAVVRAALGEVPGGTVADLTEGEERPFPDLILAVRRWLGLPAPVWCLPVPGAVLSVLSSAADAMGWLGWRSPLRSNALATLRAGIRGDPATWSAIGGAPCRPLLKALAAMPATLQERWFARMYLAFPLVIAVLAAFWLASGAVGLARFGAAQAVLTAQGYPAAASAPAVAAGSILDLALGAAVLWRPWTRLACLGMVAVSLSYLVAGTLLTPHLWADPLGPLAKIAPAAMLALVGAALADER